MMEAGIGIPWFVAASQNLEAGTDKETVFPLKAPRRKSTLEVLLHTADLRNFQRMNHYHVK